MLGHAVYTYNLLPQFTRSVKADPLLQFEHVYMLFMCMYIETSNAKFIMCSCRLFMILKFALIHSK